VRAIVKKSRKRAYSQVEDSAKLSQILLASKMLKVLQLILIIFSMSYFTGVLWFIKCFYGHEHHHDEFSMVAEFDLDVIPIKDAAIALTYYMFTSLSTVGLGDYHPITSSERVIVAFMLLFGVMITSFTMENFSLMLKELKNFNEGY